MTLITGQSLIGQFFALLKKQIENRVIKATNLSRTVVAEGTAASVGLH